MVIWNTRPHLPIHCTTFRKQCVKTDGLRRRTVNRYAATGRPFCDVDLWTHDIETLISSRSETVPISSAVQELSGSKVVAWLPLSPWPCKYHPHITWTWQVGTEWVSLKYVHAFRRYKGVKGLTTHATQRPDIGLLTTICLLLQWPAEAWRLTVGYILIFIVKRF